MTRTQAREAEAQNLTYARVSEGGVASRGVSQQPEIALPYMQSHACEQMRAMANALVDIDIDIGQSIARSHGNQSSYIPSFKSSLVNQTFSRLIPAAIEDKRRTLQKKLLAHAVQRVWLRDYFKSCP